MFVDGFFGEVTTQVPIDMVEKIDGRLGVSRLATLKVCLMFHIEFIFCEQVSRNHIYVTWETFFLVTRRPDKLDPAAPFTIELYILEDLNIRPIHLRKVLLTTVQ